MNVDSDKFKGFQKFAQKLHSQIWTEFGKPADIQIKTLAMPENPSEMRVILDVKLRAITLYECIRDKNIKDTWAMLHVFGLRPRLNYFVDIDFPGLYHAKLIQDLEETESLVENQVWPNSFNFFKSIMSNYIIKGIKPSTNTILEYKKLGDEFQRKLISRRYDRFIGGPNEIDFWAKLNEELEPKKPALEFFRDIDLMKDN